MDFVSITTYKYELVCRITTNDRLATIAKIPLMTFYLYIGPYIFMCKDASYYLFRECRFCRIHIVSLYRFLASGKCQI